MNNGTNQVTVEDFQAFTDATPNTRLLTKQEAGQMERRLVAYEFIDIVGGRVLFFCTNTQYAPGLLPKGCVPVDYVLPFRIRGGDGDLTHLDADELVQHLTTPSFGEPIHCLESLEALVTFINRGVVAGEIVAAETPAKMPPMHANAGKRAVSRSAFERINFNCSHCGIAISRIVTTMAAAEEHDTAMFCSLKCARQNRMAGFAKLSASIRTQAAALAADGVAYRTIADTLNASPQAMEAFLFHRKLATAELQYTTRPVKVSGPRVRQEPLPVKLRTRKSRLPVGYRSE